MLAAADPRRRGDILPECHLSWGGALLPAIQQVDPVYRTECMRKYHIPKLIEEGYRREVIDRVVRAAGDGRGARGPGTAESKRSTDRASRPSGAAGAVLLGSPMGPVNGGKSVPQLPRLPQGQGGISPQGSRRTEAATTLSRRGHCTGQAFVPTCSSRLMQTNQLAPADGYQYFAGPARQLGPIGRMLDSSWGSRSSPALVH